MAVPFEITDTYTLLATVENIKLPNTYLADTFFPNRQAVFSDYFAIEYRESQRSLAPAIVRDSGGVNIGRGKSKIARYAIPTFGAKRVISIDDLRQRQFGEEFIFSKVTPEERQARMQAEDLVELLRLHANRRNKVAADILTTGKTTLKSYADDGRVIEQEEIDFGWNGLITPTTDWTDSDATIYDDLYAVSERIQESTSTIPTLAICGKNVEKYLLANKQLKEWLAIPNRENLAMLSLAPTFTDVQARFIGYLSALNLTFTGYYATYRDDDGTVKPFIPDDCLLICNPGLGTIYTGAVTLLEADGNFRTYASEYVPQYLSNIEARQISLTVYSRFLPVPRLMDDWCCLKVAQ